LKIDHIKKKLGQHTLINKCILEEIIKFAHISKRDTVFEIGAGFGNLTEKLCINAGYVISYEIDKNLYEKANFRLNHFQNLKLIQGDAFTSIYYFDKLVSNIPYSRSRDLIEWLGKKKFNRAIITVQKEFAKKLLSKPGSKGYRAITVIAQSIFNIKSLRDVPKNSFKPSPKVDSMVLVLKPKGRVRLDNLNVKYIKLLFSFKGKMLNTALKRIFEKKRLDYKNLIINFPDSKLQKRIEKLKVNDLVFIAKRLANIMNH
jgi:18S rRNA (adenine1779-N6/adenine1780-N6)-dimethyltransferase